MIRTMLGAAATLALTTGLAAAQTADDLRAMSPDELKETIRGLEFVGFALPTEECGVDCLSADGSNRGAFLAALAKAASDASGDPEANAPRVDLSAESVFFSGNRLLRRTRGRPQVVFLDFEDSGAPGFNVDVVLGFGPNAPFLGTISFDEFPFTDAQKEEIRDRIAADYEEFDFVITLDEPATDDFARLGFADNDNTPGNNNITVAVDFGPDGQLQFAGFTGILFGRANGIDFGNDDLGTGSFADANFYAVLADLFPAGFFNRLTGLDGDLDGDGVVDPEALAIATVNQAANTGAHEIGHTVGLRHHDAFGAPGDGLPPQRPAPGTFIPVYEGPTEASETFFHLMASGASSGLTIQGSSNRDRFFSERSALKLEFAEEARVYDETKLRVDRRTHARAFNLIRNAVPNTLESGENSDGRFIAMDTAWIQGSIGARETDRYVFRAGRSMFVNAEVISFTDSFIEEPVIAELRLYKVGRRGQLELISANNQTFEPFDPLLLDIEIPSAGEYVVEVATPDIIYLDLDGDGVAADSLIEAGFGSLLSGDYDLIVYQVDRPLGRSPEVNRRRREERIAARRSRW